MRAIAFTVFENFLFHLKNRKIKKNEETKFVFVKVKCTEEKSSLKQFCYMCSCFDVDVVEVAPVRGTIKNKLIYLQWIRVHFNLSDLTSVLM